MSEYYLYFKFLHYIFFVSWMAFLFYQPRLYVYHAENMDKPDFVKVVEVQEYKMYHYIGWVALIGSFVKILVVVLMAIYHLDLGRYMKQLREKRCSRSGMFFRAYNEVPTICLLIIIWVMIVNPF